MDKKTILIALPSTGQYDFRTVASLLSFDVPEGYKFQFNLIANCLIYDARDKLVQYAKDVKASHIFFMDADMTPPPHTIKHLISHKKDIVTGMIFKRAYPFQPCFYTKCSVSRDMQEIDFQGPLDPDKWPSSGILELEGCGMACCLIDMKVFESMKAPYFFPRKNIGEDLTFCINARKQGFKIWLDFSVDCGHLSSMPVIKDSYANALAAWFSDPRNQGKQIFGDTI